MGNQTVLTELYFSGLSDLPSLQLPLLLFFFLIYLLTLIWNLLIITLIATHTRLHTPMYFFLGNLASLDLCCSSVTVPRMLFDLLTKRKLIPTTACRTQIFLFVFFASTEFFLLAVMSYDRYVAICHPLHYMQKMNWKLCIQLAAIVWFFGFIYSLVFTLFTLKLTLCASNIIEGFFCDLPQLFKISCSDITDNILLMLIMGSIVGAVSLSLTFFPYVSIVKTVLKIRVNRRKVFSTCSSHMTVVCLNYGTIIFNYFRPSASIHYSIDKVISVIYTVIIPLFNPLIYSLRNQDFRTALRDVLIKDISNSIPNSFKLLFKS